MRIAVDAMGSDAHPVPDVEGAVLAAREYRHVMVLVGDEAYIQTELAKHNTTGLSIEVVHAPQTITMTDKPSQVGRGKPESSIHIGSQLVHDGKADAFVTMGNTGAVLTIATLHTLRRVRGVKRPALSAILPIHAKPVILIDTGANADSKTEWIFQYAVMGNLYAKAALGIKSPRVGVLSTGEEEGKGNEQIREVSSLIQSIPLMNYVGNVEPKDVLSSKVDVVVSDGFPGNIFLKTMEAFGTYMFDLMRQEFRADLISKTGGVISRPALKRVYHRVDPNEVGGAPLLGVNGVVIIGHGRSTAIGVKNAIRQACAAVEGGFIDALRTRFEKEHNLAIKTE